MEGRLHIVTYGKLVVLPGVAGPGCCWGAAGVLPGVAGLPGTCPHVLTAGLWLSGCRVAGSPVTAGYCRVAGLGCRVAGARAQTCFRLIFLIVPSAGLSFTHIHRVRTAQYARTAHALRTTRYKAWGWGRGGMDWSVSPSFYAEWGGMIQRTKRREHHTLPAKYPKLCVSNAALVCHAPRWLLICAAWRLSTTVGASVSFNR